METFKALYIDNGVVKAGEFPETPLYFPYYSAGDERYENYNKLAEEKYSEAIAFAKANAVECEDPQQARKLILFYNSKEVLNSACLADMKDGIYRIPSGWDYRVENRIAKREDEPDFKVAKLYRVNEQKDEDDGLIAEFMGATISTREYAGTSHTVYNFPGKAGLDWWVEYDTSWDWLMPVVEKIESIRVEDDLYFRVEINRNGCRIYRSWTTSQDRHFGWHQTGNKLRSTYAAVVEFIKWYNQQEQSRP